MNPGGAFILLMKLHSPDFVSFVVLLNIPERLRLLRPKASGPGRGE